MKTRSFLLCGMLIAVTGFAESNTPIARSEKAQLRDTGQRFAVRIAAGSAASEENRSAVKTKLTLELAFTLARNHSSTLRAARLHTQAAEKAVATAGLWKNPKLKFEAEGVGGDLDGFNDAEFEIGVMQTFQRGGKQKYARDAARKAISVALKTETEKEMELLANVRLAFIEVVAQQETGKVREEQEELGRAFVKVAKRRHAAGGASELDVVEAELALEEIILSQTCCFGDLEAARIKLATMLGLSEKEMGELVIDYYALEILEPATLAATHPALQRLDAQIETVRARAQQARAKDAADITVGAGYKHEAAEDVSTFVLGASMPLSFVRQGRAEQAFILAQVDALQAKREGLRRKYQQDLSVLIAQYKGAVLEAELTREKLIPHAQKAYDLSRAGYDAGRFSWFELITAQQHLAEIRVRQIEALQDAHQLRAKISRYMGDLK